jgi:hypothetical protein
MAWIENLIFVASVPLGIKAGSFSIDGNDEDEIRVSRRDSIAGLKSTTVLLDNTQHEALIQKVEFTPDGAIMDVNANGEEYQLFYTLMYFNK